MANTIPTELRTEEMWWEWHERAYETVEDAEAACAAWVAGESDHGPTELRCECGDATGERCQWVGDPAETVVVEWMPVHLRGSHSAAGNRGRWPANGALRLRVHRECAELLTHEPDEDGEPGEPSEWAHIVEGE